MSLATSTPSRWLRRLRNGLLLLLAVLIALAALYLWLVLSWSYSEGERVGYVQKFSKKGWLCKTWEGELALVTMPGTMTEKFAFSVRDDQVAARINASLGRPVALIYEQHIGVPSSCFAETQHYVVDIRPLQGDLNLVRPLGETGAAAGVPGAPVAPATPGGPVAPMAPATPAPPPTPAR